MSYFPSCFRLNPFTLLTSSSLLPWAVSSWEKSITSFRVMRGKEIREKGLNSTYSLIDYLWFKQRRSCCVWWSLFIPRMYPMICFSLRSRLDNLHLRLAIYDSAISFSLAVNRSLIGNYYMMSQCIFAQNVLFESIFNEAWLSCSLRFYGVIKKSSSSAW